MTGTIRILALTSATIAMLLAVSGCSSALAPTPEKSGSSSATSSAMPTAAPVQPDLSSRPEDRVPLACDALMGESELALVMKGVPGTSISAQPFSANNGTVSTLQGGMLQCLWATPTDADPAMGRWNIRLEILPEATEAYQTAIASFDSDGSMQPLVGPNSFVSCLTDGPSRSCTVRFETDGYWVELTYGGLASSHPTQAELLQDAATIGNTIRDGLSDAGAPRPQFAPSADAATPWASCADVDAGGEFRSALGSSSFVAPEGYEGGPAMFSVAMQRAGFTTCVWRHADVYTTPAGELRQVGIEMIPGAGWAWPELRESALAQDADAQIAIAGADDAVVVCWDVDECTVQALVRGSYVAADASNQQGNSADARAGAIRALELAIAAL